MTIQFCVGIKVMKQLIAEKDFIIRIIDRMSINIKLLIIARSYIPIS